MTWNKAAMQWANYRVPKPRKLAAQMVQPTRTVGDASDPTAACWTGPANEYPDVGCRLCGFLHCAGIPGKCVPAALRVRRAANRTAEEAYRDLLLHGITYGE